MSSSIHFQAISGAFDEQPLSYLLSIDQVTILLDCGWSDQLATDSPLLDTYKKYLKHVDLILLSHGDVEHMGALPYLVARLGLNCPIFATLAAANMGRQCLHDCLLSKRQCEDFTLFTRQDIDTAFDRIQPLTYSQNIALSGKSLGISIVPLRAGHTIGGAFWRIKKDTDEILYAVSYNHKTERHLAGTVLDSFSRPSLLITDAYNAKSVQATRKQRNIQLMDSILSVLRNDGSVLIPIDSSTRVLELTFILDQLWAYHQLSFPIVFLSHRSKRTIEYAKGMMEWMVEEVTRQFSNTRESPYEFKSVKLLQRWEDVQKLGNGPKVILASCPSLETGYARELFYQWSLDERNLVLLTSRGLPGTLARELYDCMQENTTYPETTKTISRRVPLEGDELARFLQAEQEKKEREDFIARKKRIMEGDEESDVEDDLDQHLLFLGDHFDHYKRGNKTTGLSFFANDTKTAMFPSWENRVKFDDYGETIDPEDYRMASVEQANQQQLQAMQIDQQNNEKVDEEEDETSTPSKYITLDTEIRVLCQTKFIDFEGLSDGKSIGLILQRVAPKKLVLVRGTEESTMALRTHLETSSETPPEEIFTPRVGELIRVSAATNIYQVKLTDALVTSLKMAKMNEYELAYIHGVIRYDGVTGEAQLTSALPAVAAAGEEQAMDVDTPPSEASLDTAADQEDQMDLVKKDQDGAAKQPTGEPEEEEAEQTLIPSLDVLPSTERWKTHPPLVIGDPKLTELKRLLQLESIPADFDKGSLIIGANREMRVTKDEKGAVVMEGPFSRVYYKVRSLLYKLHAFL